MALCACFMESGFQWVLGKLGQMHRDEVAEEGTGL